MIGILLNTLTGLEIVSFVKQKFKKIKIIVVTDSHDEYYYLEMNERSMGLFQSMMAKKYSGIIQYGISVNILNDHELRKKFEPIVRKLQENQIDI